MGSPIFGTPPPPHASPCLVALLGLGGLTRAPFGGPFVRVPYYIGDLKRDPNLENDPYTTLSIDMGNIARV